MPPKKTPKSRNAVAKPRLTQAARRDATRKKILDATLYCLAKHGYANTGVSQVVGRARVSRGAWAHHFPSMNALMLEAAQHLMTQVYERLALLMVELEGSKDRMHDVSHRIWQEFFASEVNEIYLELLVASRRDAKLAATLSTLSAVLERNLSTAVERYFESRPDAIDSVPHVMLLLRWTMRGMALDAHMLPKGAVETTLDTCGRLLTSQMQPRGTSSGSVSKKR